MDEPQLTSEVVEGDVVVEKNDLLEAAFEGSDSEKPMEVDNNPLDDEPSTSVSVAPPAEPEEIAEPAEDRPVEPPQEDAGPETDVSMTEDLPNESIDQSNESTDQPNESVDQPNESVDQPNESVDQPNESVDQLNESVDPPSESVDLPNESVEQVIFDKPSELDETAQSEVDILDFTERSINYSQLDAAHHDDSNDAFNALKESETDALQEPKDELENTEQVETAETGEGEKEPDKEAEAPTDPPETPMETEDVDGEDTSINKDIESVDQTMDQAMDQTTADDSHDVGTDALASEVDESHDMGTDAAAMDADDSDLMGPPKSVEKPDEEEVEEIPDDDGMTETTNEGEGVDENVCLLGDETEVNEADKDSASHSEAVDDEEGESTTVEKEAGAIDEVIEIGDADEADKAADEPEAVEVEEEPVEELSQPLKENEIREVDGEVTEQSCLNCENTANCLYQLLEESGEIKFLCTFNCVKEHREDNAEKYSLSQKKVQIYEIREPTTEPAEELCSKCAETKVCKYHYRVHVTETIMKDPPAPAEGEELPEEPPQPIVETVKTLMKKFICEEACLKEFIGDNTEKWIVNEVKRRSGRVREVPKPIEEEQEVPKIVARSDAEVEAARIDRDESFIRRCAQCFLVVNFTAKSMHWETLDFCNERCLGQYQNVTGASCAQCYLMVSMASMGKLCVRFGPEVKQFCATECLNDYKKNQHPCSLCSKNLKLDDGEPVTLKRGNNFCDDKCAKRYDEIINPKKKRSPYLCSVCNNKKVPKVEILLDENTHRFCSSPCFSAFKFVNNVVPDQCDMCTTYFERKTSDSHTLYQGESPKIFCTRECMGIFITKNREIWQCNWCKVSKYNFDIISTNNGTKRMCSLNCLSLYEVSINALSRKRSKCDHCKASKQPQYHLTMSDASIRNFCTYQCVLGFQSQFSKSRIAAEMPSVVPAGTAKRIKPASANLAQHKQQPIISLVRSLSSRRGGRQPYNPITNRRSGSPIPVPEITVQLERLSEVPARVKVSSLSSLTGSSSAWIPISTSRGSSPVRVEHKTQVVTIPPLPKAVGNKSTMCKAITLNKAINCVPMTAEAECQTEDWLEQRIIVPLPIPIFVPQPMMMYSLPAPVAVPFVLPVPVPIFVPTTRNSASGIMKEIKKIQEKMPTDPYEAELLMMAEMVAGDKKQEENDSDSDENNEMEYGDGIEHNSSFNEDLVQMAFKMAGNDFDDPPVDLENEMTANTISQSSNAYGDDMDHHSLQHHQLLLLQQQRDAVAMQSQRGRKRMPQPVATKPTNNRNSAPNKRIKREMEVMQPEMPREPAEKPDANMCLKYTFGVNAWKQWVATKNADFEKSSIRRKPIKSEILQLTADELNYSLCMFVKEVRKPNGSEYAPDTIYYLVLGIQQYLYENGRIDNIFTDRYYEQFTDCLDEVAKKFSVLYNDSQYIVTRVEEEHLWECKQLGAHSPHVLLSTLMFFNTKHFNLVTVDEHMELSFSHIMKHWKRNPNQPGAAKVPGSRNVLLRFYPPQSSLEANSRKKKVYEQQENEENPLRCPVKLYEFYLSKCPESVKTRNDVFYLQPERSCVPDSPVWYSTQPLSRDALSKMLHRVKMVKEINIALLTS